VAGSHVARPDQVSFFSCFRLWYALAAAYFDKAVIGWLVVENKNDTVLQFCFIKVPLDGVIILPALTVSIFRERLIDLSLWRFTMEHIQAVFYALVAFFAHGGFTDLNDVGKAFDCREMN
jgi:hypothetical protein